jgi:uncharacterized protein (TIGR02118 family)
MTIKLVVLYTQPDDPAAFDEHYFGVHMPLVAKLPGLERTETAKITTALDGGEQTYYRITALYFPDQDAMGAAFGSPEGAATAEDYGQIAPPGSRMLIGVLDG